MNVNPYQSPTADCGPAAQKDVGVDPRATWLVRTSLGLAIFLEVLPTEVDTTYAAVVYHNLPLFFLIKIVFLAIILLPLVAYIGLSGWHGLKAVSGKVTTITIILSLRMVMDVFMIAEILRR